MSAELSFTPGAPGRASEFDPVAESKRILRSLRVATLATLTGSGAPFATLTTIATDYDGSPILLSSRLSAHTRHLDADPRCSLLLAEGGRGDPLAHPRLTLMGTAARVEDPTIRARYLRRNPKAALYVDFPDFGFWRLRLAAVHLNGGFARAADFDAEALLTDLAGAQSLIAAEADILAHLNGDHPETLALLAGAGTGRWQAGGLDPEGLDLICGDATSRVAFPRRAETPDDVRDMLIELAKAARAA